MSVKHRHEDMSGSADFFWLGETFFEWKEPFSVLFVIWYLVTRSDSSHRNLPTVFGSRSSMAECFHLKYLCFSHVWQTVFEAGEPCSHWLKTSGAREAVNSAVKRVRTSCCEG